MKAAVYHRFGPPEVVAIEERPRPVPAAGEVLIEVHATTVTAADWRFRSGRAPPGLGWLARLMMGIRKPRYPVLGTECAGVVAGIGEGVSDFAEGDRVLAFSTSRFGCHAEYVAVPVGGVIVRLPEELAFHDAAALAFAGSAALDFLTVRARVQRGEAVLVIGAAGGVGSAAMQIAKNRGCAVTGVCHARHMAVVRELGAEEVIDYGVTDVATLGRRFDAIFDTSGSVAWGVFRQLLNPKGRAALLAAGLGQMVLAPLVAAVSDKRILVGNAREAAEDLELMARLTVEGTYRPLIGATLPLHRIVEAYRLQDSGAKTGSTVLEVVSRDAA